MTQSPIRISATRTPGDAPVRANESVQQMIQTILAKPDGQYLVTVNRSSVVKVQEVSRPLAPERPSSDDPAGGRKVLKMLGG